MMVTVAINPRMTMAGHIVSNPFKPPSMFTAFVTIMTINGIIIEKYTFPNCIVPINGIAIDVLAGFSGQCISGKAAINGMNAL